MPEIPEMEIYKTFLESSVLGKIIKNIKVNREKSINYNEEELNKRAAGISIDKIERRGKAILLRLSNKSTFLAHMMLDGRIYLSRNEEDNGFPGKSHISLSLSDEKVLHFCEMRLGYVKLLDEFEVEQFISRLGIEPLSPEFTPSILKAILNSKRGMIKPLLMDQKIITGIGNAYSNEILFAARIHPERKSFTIDDDSTIKLYNAIQTVLNEAISEGGYIEEPFSSSDNLSGGYIPHFKVYDRTREPCIKCNLPILEKVVGGRNAFFCEFCQH